MPDKTDGFNAMIFSLYEVIYLYLSANRIESQVIQRSLFQAWADVIYQAHECIKRY